MNKFSSQETNHSHNNEIDLRDLFGILWQGKILIVIITVCFAAFSILYTLTLPDIYRSEALLATSESQDGLSASIQQSVLTGLAGFNFANTSTSKSDQAIEVLSSRSFFIDKIFPNIYIPDLMANPRWDSETNTLSYDEELYDNEQKQWVREVDFPYQITPSAQESYAYFIEEKINVTTDNTTGFVTLSVDHVSPFIARDWTELIIHEINELYREKDREIALSSITYLNNQIASTNVVEVRQALSQLLQKQIQTSMLTDASKAYVFDVLDPPIPPLHKNSPSRALILVMAILIGGMLGVSAVFARHYSRRDVKL